MSADIIVITEKIMFENPPPAGYAWRRIIASRSSTEIEAQLVLDGGRDRLVISSMRYVNGLRGATLKFWCGGADLEYLPLEAVAAGANEMSRLTGVEMRYLVGVLR